MTRRILAFLLVLMLLPAAALAELEYNRHEKRFIDFPAMDDWRGEFSYVTKWIIVTPETLEENWDMVAARGDTEEEIRARYADEHFLFEAYSPDLPEDACFRAEVYEDDFTRDVWHFRHWKTDQRKELNDYLMSGHVLPDRDVYSLVNKESGEKAYVQGYFTNYPPATMESGKIRFDFRNGRMYVFSYCVSGRLAGASRWYTDQEDAQYNRTPMSNMDTRFMTAALPRLPLYALDGAIPEDVAPGEVTLTGTVEAGSSISATLDGQEISATVDKKGNFTVTLPLTEPGAREIVLTVAHKKFTTRTMRYTVNVSDALTPLTIAEAPTLFDEVGELTLTGLTAPGAEVAVALDGGEPTLLTADEAGAFTHAFQAEEPGVYELVVTAKAPDLAENRRELAFTADFEDVQDGIDHFSEKLTDVDFETVCANLEEYIGQRVKVEIYIKEVEINEQGLALIGVHNSGKDGGRNPYGGYLMPSDEENALLYVNLPGYAQCQLGEKMILTVYATVDGTRLLFDETGEEEERIELTMSYGTYIIMK